MGDMFMKRNYTDPDDNAGQEHDRIVDHEHRITALESSVKNVQDDIKTIREDHKQIMTSLQRLATGQKVTVTIAVIILILSV